MNSYNRSDAISRSPCVLEAVSPPPHALVRLITGTEHWAAEPGQCCSERVVSDLFRHSDKTGPAGWGFTLVVHVSVVP